MKPMWLHHVTHIFGISAIHDVTADSTMPFLLGATMAQTRHRGVNLEVEGATRCAKATGNFDSSNLDGKQL